ncbi:MAG: alpha/beta fold hydrolase, partial [Acidimicrobiales bacterium]
LARAGGRRRAPVGLRLVKAARRAGLASEGRVEAARLRHGSTDYRRAEGVMRQTLVREVNERYEEDLARLACPVELVWGERDDVAPLDVAQRAAAMIARSRLSVCPGASHLLCLEEPQALREAIERHRP